MIDINENNLIAQILYFKIIFPELLLSSQSPKRNVRRSRQQNQHTPLGNLWAESMDLCSSLYSELRLLPETAFAGAG